MPTFRNASSGNFNTASPVVTAPSGLTDGDVILILISTNDIVAIGGAPTLNGFTILGGAIQTHADSSGCALVLYKVASSEGASWTFSDLLASLTLGAYGSVAYSAGILPFNQSAQSTPAAAATVTSSSITPSVDNCMIVALFGGDPTGGVVGAADTSPAATERVDQNNGGGGHAYIEEYLQGTAASVALDMTQSVGAVAYSVTIVAIAPAGGGDTPIAIPVGGVSFAGSAPSLQVFNPTANDARIVIRRS